MAEPLSIVASIGTALRASYSIIKVLYTFIDDTVVVDRTIQELLDEFDSLRSIIKLVDNFVKGSTLEDQKWLDTDVQDVVEPLEFALARCTRTLTRFEDIIIKSRKTKPLLRFIHQPLTQIKLDFKSAEILVLRKQIASHTTSIQIGFQAINIQVSLQNPEAVISVLSPQIESLNKLLSELSSGQGLVQSSSLTPISNIVQSDDRLSRAAQRVITTARSVISSKSTVADGSIYNHEGIDRPHLRDPSLYGSVMGDDKRQGISEWASNLETLAEASRTSQSQESTEWVSKNIESDSDEDMNVEEMKDILDRANITNSSGNKEQAEKPYRKAFELAGTLQGRSKDRFQRNETAVGLASNLIDQGKAREAKAVLLQLLSWSEPDLPTMEAKQMATGLYSISRVLLELGDFDEASSRCRDAKKAWSKLAGRSSLEYKDTHKLSLAIHEASDQSKAIPLEPSIESGEIAGAAMDATVEAICDTATETSPRYRDHLTESIHVNHGPAIDTQKQQGDLVMPDSATQEDIERLSTSKPTEDAALGADLRFTHDEERADSEDTLGHKSSYKVEMGTVRRAYRALRLKSCYKFSSSFDPQLALGAAIENDDLLVASVLVERFHDIKDMIQHSMITMRSGLDSPSSSSSNVLPDNLDLESVIEGVPLLVHAIRHSGPKFCNIVDLLLHAGCNVNIEWSGASPLTEAVLKNNIEVVQLLLAHHSNIERKTASETQSPLSAAAERGFTSIAQALLSAGAKVDGTGFARFVGFVGSCATPLNLAAFAGHRDVLEILLQHGAEIESKETKYGFTPLVTAARFGHDEVLQSLLHHKANANVQANDGRTALCLASFSGHRKIVQVLLEHGVDVNKASITGFTPLHTASQKGHRDIVQDLLNYEVNADISSIDGYTPLFVASVAGHGEVVQALLAHGVNAETQTHRDKYRPLHMAAFNGHHEIVELLLKAGAEVNPQTLDGVTPLYYAARNGATAIVRLLAQYGANIETARADGCHPLHAAAEEGHTSTVELLLELNAKISVYRAISQTPLSMASEKGHHNVVRIILKALFSRARLDPEASNDFSRMIMGPGAFSQYDKLRIDELLNTDAQQDTPFDTNALTRDGFTLLMIAVANDHEEIVKVILDGGGDPNRTGNAYTPLDLAVRSRAINKMLKAHGGEGHDYSRGDVLKYIALRRLLRQK